MANSVKDYFDLSDPLVHSIHDVADGILPSRFSFSDLLRSSTDLKRFLELLRDGELNVFCQERIFEWIYRLSYGVKHLNSQGIPELFKDAMDSMHDHADQWFSKYDHEIELDSTALSEHYGFGGHAAANNYGLRKVRILANLEAFKHFGYRFGRYMPERTVDYPAKLEIFISSPRYAEVAEAYAGCYLAGSTIREVEKGVWIMQFDEHYLCKETEFLWNLDLWGKIFFAIKPELEKLFAAEISFKRQDRFND
jgi:hypothetical protein